MQNTLILPPFKSAFHIFEKDHHDLLFFALAYAYSKEYFS